MLGRRFFLVLILVGGCLFFNQAAEAITVGPSLLEVVAEPGETFIQEIKLFNETNESLTVYPVAENVAPKDGGSQLRYLGNQAAVSAAKWIILPTAKVVLKPGELKKILLNIRVPKLLVRPGGYYAALFWTDQPPKEAGISVANRLGTIFLFKIKGGEIVEGLKILSFEKEKNKLAFNLRIENNGNTHLRPVGQMTIYNWRHRPVETIAVNSLGQFILPQSRRWFQAVAGKELGWGKFYVQTRLNYGSANQEIISQGVTFWSAPVHWFSQLLGAVFLLILVKIIIKLARKKSQNHESV